jgi:acetyl esterase/lipase
MKSCKSVALATISLSALLSAASPTIAAQTPKDASAQAASQAATDDSGTMKRANKEMRQVLTKLQELGAKPLGTQSVEGTRKGPTPADAVKALLKDQGKDPAALMAEMKVDTQDLTYPTAGSTQPIRIYKPVAAGDGPLPVVVYYHGGGWVIADINTYESSAMALAKKTGAIVASVEYRHAPENKFPAAHEDAFAAYEWVRQNAPQFGGDPARVAVAGESAGGNLAANVAIMARDQKVEIPAYMLLVYPVAGTDMTTASYKKNEHAVPLSKQAMEWFAQNTIKSEADLKDPRLDLVGGANLEGLPDATIITAEIDPLMSEGKLLADKLKMGGSKVRYKNFENVTHEFFGMNAVVAEAEKAQQFAAQGLKTALTDAATGSVKPPKQGEAKQ